jgi:hypothetical protein
MAFGRSDDTWSGRGPSRVCCSSDYSGELQRPYLRLKAVVGKDLTPAQIFESRAHNMRLQKREDDLADTLDVENPTLARPV